MPMKQVLSFLIRGWCERAYSGDFLGLYAHRPALKPKLTENQKVNRLAWAKDHRRWNRAQWSDVLFSDEATYVVDAVDRKIRCFRKKGERFNQNMVL